MLDMATSGTTATLLAKRWESALLVNVDNGTLQRLMDNKAAMAALIGASSACPVADSVLQTVVQWGTPPGMPGSHGVVRESVAWPFFVGYVGPTGNT